MMTLKEALIEEYKEKGKQLVETFLEKKKEIFHLFFCLYLFRF